MMPSELNNVDKFRNSPPQLNGTFITFVRIRSAIRKFEGVISI